MDGGWQRAHRCARSNSDLAYDERFASDFPMVAEALLSGASAQLRNAATAGGNLLQRPAAPIFRIRASAATGVNRAPVVMHYTGKIVFMR